MIKVKSYWWILQNFIRKSQYFLTQLKTISLAYVHAFLLFIYFLKKRKAFRTNIIEKQSLSQPCIINKVTSYYVPLFQTVFWAKNSRDLWQLKTIYYMSPIVLCRDDMWFKRDDNPQRRTSYVLVQRHVLKLLKLKKLINNTTFRSIGN